MQDYHSLIISNIIWYNRVRDYDPTPEAVPVVQGLIRACTATTYLQILEVSGVCRTQG